MWIDSETSARRPMVQALAGAAKRTQHVLRCVEAVLAERAEDTLTVAAPSSRSTAALASGNPLTGQRHPQRHPSCSSRQLPVV